MKNLPGKIKDLYLTITIQRSVDDSNFHYSIYDGIDSDQPLTEVDGGVIVTNKIEEVLDAIKEDIIRIKKI